MTNNNNTDVNIKVTYYFATGEKSEITVDLLMHKEGMSEAQALELCTFLLDMDDKDAKLERKETRRHEPLSKFTEDNPPKFRNEPLSIEDEFLLKEDMDKLYEIIDKNLSHKQKRRVINRIFKGMSEEEIGALEGVKQQAISQSILAALKKIKTFF